MSQRLTQFVLDEATKGEVEDFVIAHLERKAVERVFGGKDIGGIRDARELLKSAFTEMEVLFKPEREKKVDTPE